ncbi:MAG: nickel-dependent lactate racemase [Archaeoglobaceae archaeon]
MTAIGVPYGKTTMKVEIGDNVEVEYLKPEDLPPVDIKAELSTALENPISNNGLEDFRGADVAIVVSDQTRPVPSKTILEVLIPQLKENGVNEQDITIIVGGGLHRRTGSLKEILGKDIVERVGKAIIHDARREDKLVYLGDTSRGTPIWINKQFIEAQKKIVVGMIDPHHFMGYTGGAKGAAIGLAGKKTVEANHSLLMAEGSRLGAMKGNPCREDLEEMGSELGIDLIINAVLNLDKQVARILTGHWLQAHREGVKFARKMVEAKYPYHADVVISSPGGFPKDLNIYQSQKALSSAEMVCKPQGVIILVAECPHGLGNEFFEETMNKFGTHEEVISYFQSLSFRMGIHKAYMWSRQLTSRKIILVSHRLSPEEIKALKVDHAPDLESALRKTREFTAMEKVLVMPLASSTVPTESGP